MATAKSVDFDGEDRVTITLSDGGIQIVTAIRYEGKRNREHQTVTISVRDWVRLVRRAGVEIDTTS